MKQRIPVLDDDPDILDIISYILTDNGYEVVALDSGEQVLGSMDGRAICNQLKHRSETNAIPVVLISASHHLAQTLNQDGAPNDLIAKSFDIDYLLRKVEHQLAA